MLPEEYVPPLPPLIPTKGPSQFDSSSHDTPPGVIIQSTRHSEGLEPEELPEPRTGPPDLGEGFGAVGEDISMDWESVGESQMAILASTAAGFAAEYV